MEEYATTIDALLDDLEFRALKERLHTALHPGAAGEEAAPKAIQEVDQNSLEETAVALWLLRSDTTTPSLDDILQYAHTEDFERAREFIFTKLRETGSLMSVYETIERPLIPIIHRMNVDGVRVDADYLKGLSREYTEELAKIAARIYGYAGHEFNISSPKQLGVVLYDELNITPAKQKKTATGARTTREDELAKMSHLHPIIDDVLAYRELQKLLGTYIDKIPELVGTDGRLHAEFLAAGTTTGRMASKDPNLQNIPIRTDYGRRIRNAFAAEKGNSILAIDYSQIELRIAAGLSGDEKLVQVFRDGRDVHTEVAAQVFNVPPEQVDREMRRRAKIINFGILYGMGANALRANLGDSVTREEAGNYIEEYFKNFSGVARFVEKTKADAARQGFTETLFGRRRYFPGFQSSLPGLKAQAERMAVNAPIQGTQADIIKLAMIAADALVEKEGWRSDVRMLMQVHDELVFEVTSKKIEEIAGALRSAMEGVVDTARLSGVPIAAEASIGENWGELKRIAR